MEVVVHILGVDRVEEGKRGAAAVSCDTYTMKFILEYVYLHGYWQ